MSNYVTQTSDKSREEALRQWKRGCYGVLGTENFYVGKILRGVLHFAAGLYFFVILFASAVAAILGLLSGLLPFYDVLAIVTMVGGIWAVIAVPNLYKIKMGKFRDNTGAFLRE